MSNTRPVASIEAPIVDLKTGKLISPWIQFFQQFVQKAPTIIDVSSKSPYTANQLGNIIITGGTTIALKRGNVTISLANGQAIIPISIGDTVSWASGTVKFLGS
jgi:translation elongation factor EF-4